jgi:hypothetical protein
MMYSGTSFCTPVALRPKSFVVEVDGAVIRQSLVRGKRPPEMWRLPRRLANRRLARRRFLGGTHFLG